MESCCGDLTDDGLVSICTTNVIIRPLIILILKNLIKISM